MLHALVISAQSTLGDLDGECADAAGRAVDQDLLPWLHPGLVPQVPPGGSFR